MAVIAGLMAPISGGLLAQQPMAAYPQQMAPYAGEQAPAYPAQNEPGQNPAYGNDYGAPPPPDSGPEYGSTPAPQGLSPDQMEQLVAAIALYPDALLAQVLAASTYPDQVAQADQWREGQRGAPPEQIADEANAAPWDPSVKALTAFPQVLAEMDQNMQWTTELGNAYYNQPQDVFAAVQDLRHRAEAAGTLQNTPQENVSYEQGNIELAPSNPQVVYVPSYNPWSAYGSPIAPYPGFSLLETLGSLVGPAMRFGMGMVTTAFMPMNWGWPGWGLNWIGNLLTFDQQGYYSHSSTVADWGFPYGGPRAWRGGYGARYPAARYERGYGWRANGHDRRFDGQRYGDRPRRLAGSGGYGRTGQGGTRMPAFNARQRYASAGSGQYGRAAGYGTGWGNRGRQGWNGPKSGGESWARSRTPSRSVWSQPRRLGDGQYRAFAQAPRSSFGRSGFRSSGFGRGNFHARSTRNFSRSFSRSGHSGGFRGFGGGHRSFRGGGHFGGSHHGGGHGGRHR